MSAISKIDALTAIANGKLVGFKYSHQPDVEPEKDYMDHDVDRGINYWANYNDGDEPSHWMLLPEPEAQEQSHD